MTRLRWYLPAAAWSLIFATPHFYWALGGRAGLGAQAAVADAALRQGWFAAYNLAAGCLAVLGAVAVVMLAYSWGGWRFRRALLVATTIAAAALLARGLLGLTLLAVNHLSDPVEENTPPLLLAIELWFVLGGLVYGAMAVHHRKQPFPSRPSPDGSRRTS